MSLLHQIQMLDLTACTHEGTFEPAGRGGRMRGEPGMAVCRQCGMEAPAEYALAPVYDISPVPVGAATASAELAPALSADPPLASVSGNVHDLYEAYQPEWRTGGGGGSGGGGGGGSGGGGRSVGRKLMSRCSMRRQDSSKRTVMSAYSHIVRDPNILGRANQLYHQVTHTDILRKSSRRGVIFACIFYAYRMNDQLRTPDELAQQLSVSKRVISKGLKYVTLRMQRFNPTGPKGVMSMGQHVTPFHYFPMLWRKIGLAFDAPIAHDLVHLFSRLHMQHPLLNRSNPQSVACAMVYYYLCQKRTGIPCSRVSDAVGLSIVTISRLATEISKFLETTDAFPLV